MSLSAELLDLVLPRRCVGCGEPRVLLCRTCSPNEPVLRVQHATFAVCAARAYDGAVRMALLRYKERGRRDLAAPLGALLTVAVRAALDDTVRAALNDTRGDLSMRVGRAPPARVLLVPVPSGRSVAAARGGNHVTRLARIAGAQLEVRTAPALRLRRAVHDSAMLTAADRAVNMATAMVAARPRSGWAAIVVDDIVTTGATLTESCRALTAAGWPVLGAAVVAATELRRPTAAPSPVPLAVPRSSV